MIPATLPLLTGLAGSTSMLHLPGAFLIPRLLAFDFKMELLIPIISVLGTFVVGAIAIIGAMLQQTRKRQMWHETARLALEKGQPIPPLPLGDDQLRNTPPPNLDPQVWLAFQRKRQATGLMIGGFVCLGVGLGLYLFLGFAGGARFVGAIPGCIGAGLLLSGLMILWMDRPKA